MVRVLTHRLSTHLQSSHTHGIRAACIFPPVPAPHCSLQARPQTSVSFAGFAFPSHMLHCSHSIQTKERVDRGWCLRWKWKGNQFLSYVNCEGTHFENNIGEKCTVLSSTNYTLLLLWTKWVASCMMLLKKVRKHYNKLKGLLGFPLLSFSISYS